VEVDVPWAWPAAGSQLRVTRVAHAPAGVDAAALLERVNGSAELVSAGLLQLLQGLAAAAAGMVAGA